MKLICVNMLVFFLICASWMESSSAEDEPRATAGDCFELDTAYKNTDKNWETINKDTAKTTDKRASPLECQALCQQTEGCKFFTWRTNGCWLKTRGGLAAVALHSEGAVSGYKTCGNMADCFEENTVYPHNDINPSTAETTDVRSSPLECQALCKQTKGCQYFTWTKQQCGLKTKGGVVVAKKTAGAVSGFKTCDPIVNAIQSTLTNPSSRRDTTSERSKIIQDLDLKWIKAKPDLYIILKDLFLRIAENPELDDLFADFSSRFQSDVLPTMIQDEDLNSPLLKSKLKTKFPKEVEDSAQLENKEVTINGTFGDKCPWGGKCLYKWKKNWISTNLYAKQGQLVTVTVPEDLVGKFDIIVNAHTDNVHKKYMKSWLRGRTFARPSVITQIYDKTIIKQKTRLLTPYGGLIFISFGEPPVKLGEFTLKFENVITSPKFKQGETTSEEWSKALASSQSPMVEVEVPGLIIIIPKFYIDNNNLNIERVASTATKMMNAFHKMQGYVMPRPHLYVYDAAIRWGGAHGGYPIIDGSFWQELKKLENGGPKIWAMPHEIGHSLEWHTYTPSGLGDVINNIFAQYVNEEVFNANPMNMGTLKYADKFKKGDKNFKSVNLGGRLNIFKIIQQECSWETFFSFFKFYNEEIPAESHPSITEGYSLITRVLSEKCNKNLIPFFKWWNWPVLDDAEEATKDLPEWEGIIDSLDNAKKRNDLYTIHLKKGNFIKECWKESDTDTYGFDIESKIVNGENECANLCVTTTGCKFWTWRKRDNFCWTRKGDFYTINRPGYTSGSTVCASEETIKVPKDGNWNLLFRQTINGEDDHFKEGEWSRNKENVDAPNFSRLEDFDRFRKKDGTFHLFLWYPELGEGNEWTQTSNPVTQTKRRGVDNYKAISLSYNGLYWGGLSQNKFKTRSLLTGSVTGHWNNNGYEIGSFQGDSILGPGQKGCHKVKTVELYIEGEARSCKNSEFQCGNEQCIPITGQCDGQTQCEDGLDEDDELCNPINGPVSCGGHTAINCSLCPWGKKTKTNHGKKWCNKQCKWDDGKCVLNPDFNKKG